MPRKFRIVVPENPHHVIQRGNRRQQVFFCPNDKALYLKLLKEQVQKHHVKVWAYCLMDNHVHLILVPPTPKSLAKAVAETNRRFTCHHSMSKAVLMLCCHIARSCCRLETGENICSRQKKRIY